ncbi:hypothetical protein CFC21_076225, partial [Triticum aestivum]
ARAPPPRGRRC